MGTGGQSEGVTVASFPNMGETRLAGRRVAAACPRLLFALFAASDILDVLEEVCL